MDELIINYDKSKLMNIKESYIKIIDESENSQVSSDMLQFKEIIKGIEISYLDEKGSLEAIEIYKTAIKINLVGFNINSLNQYIYSYIELKCLMLIALELNLLKQFDESNIISLFVLDYIKTPLRHLESTDFLKIKVILNIAYNYHGLDDDASALKYSDIGINYCLRKKTFYLLHSLYYRKAVASYYLEEPRNEYMNLFKRSIFILTIQNMETLRKSYIKITYEKYNLKIDEQN